MARMSLMTALTLNASGFVDGIQEAEAEAKGFADVISGASKETIKAFKDIDKMGIGEMKKNLRELSQISFAGKSKEEIAAINNQIGNLRDTMGDLRAQQNVMGTELAGAMASGLQTISAMGQIGVGVASMFGASAEEAKKYEQVMIQLIGVTQAAAVVEDALSTGQLKNIALRIEAALVTGAQTVATQAATAATWLYNASLAVVIGTIGAVVAIVAAVVAGIYLLVDAHSEAAKAAEEEAFALDILKRKRLELEGANEQAIKMAKARGASAMEVKQLEIGAEQQRIDALTKTFNAELDQNGVLLKGKEEAHAETKKQLQESIWAQEVMIEELKTLGKTADAVTPKVVRPAREAKDAWVEAYFAAQRLAEFNVPQYRAPDITDMQKTEQLKDIQPEITAKLIDGLKKRHAVSNQYREMETTAAMEAARKITEAEKIAQENKLAVISNVAGDIGSLFAEQTIAYKAMAIVQASIATYLAAQYAFTSGSAINPIAGYVAMAAAIAVGVANVAKIAGIFAGGGIVPGTSYAGDKIVARVNSNEMILNGRQQAQLFDMANGSGSGGTQGTVRFVVEGTQLVGVLENYGRKSKNIR